MSLLFKTPFKINNFLYFVHFKALAKNGRGVRGTDQRLNTFHKCLWQSQFFQKKYFFKNIHVKTNYFRIYYILIYLHFLLFSTPQYLCWDQFCFMMLISQTMTSISNFGERKMAFLVDCFVSKYFVLAFGFQHTCTFVHIAHDICTFFLFSRNKTKKSTKNCFDERPLILL